MEPIFKYRKKKKSTHLIKKITAFILRMEQFGFKMQFASKQLIELENRVVPDQTIPLGQSGLIMFCLSLCKVS